MKKLFYLFAVAALISSCGGGKGYKVTGKVEGAVDGDTVFLMERSGREFNKVDSVVIKKGTFTFTGNQETPVNRFIVYAADENPMFVDFFLENGNIDVTLGAENDKVIGTPINDAYQDFREKMKENSFKQRDIYQSMAEPELTDAQKATKAEELQSAETEMVEIIKNTINNNISSPLGEYLLAMFNPYMDFNEVGELLAKLPAEAQAKPDMVTLKEQVEIGKRTAVGQKFTDLDLNDPEGQPVKLSDYAGKGKIVLVDFWASWCGPCRREMPRLVELYSKYKRKGFEIVGVSLDRDAASWKNGIEQLNITWPQMSDLKYWESEAAKTYAVRSIPHVILLDKDGTIVSRGLHGEELQAKVEELMK
ncbi:MAG: AhpC/TSA family protein [Bacteroides sp.]|nr:AhpC/TSA family protein [Bacteroides sp.]